MDKKSIFAKIDELYTNVTKTIIGDMPLDGSPEAKIKDNTSTEKKGLKDIFTTAKSKFFNLGKPRDEKALLYEEVIKREEQEVKPTRKKKIASIQKETTKKLETKESETSKKAPSKKVSATKKSPVSASTKKTAVKTKSASTTGSSKNPVNKKILTKKETTKKSVTAKKTPSKETPSNKASSSKKLAKSKSVEKKSTISTKKETPSKSTTKPDTKTTTKKTPVKKAANKKLETTKPIVTKKTPSKKVSTSSEKKTTLSKKTTSVPRGSKKAAKIALYIKDIKKHYGKVDEEFVAIIVKNLGPSIYKKDAELVSCSDPKELDTVRKNFLKKKLSIDASKGVLDAAIQDVCSELKGVRNKYRATFYYALAKKFKKESVLS